MESRQTSFGCLFKMEEVSVGVCANESVPVEKRKRKLMRQEEIARALSSSSKGSCAKGQGWI